MDIRTTIIVFTAIAGLAVLVSYVLGILRAPSAAALWGGVTPQMQKAIVPFMLVAAAGFLTFFVLLVFKAEDAVLDGLHYPWAEADGNGGKRLLLAMALFLLPAIFWLEATAWHLRDPSSLSQAVTIGSLAITGLGVALMMLLSWTAWQENVPHAAWMFWGITALGVQCILNDLVIWVYLFPWNSA